MKGERSFGKIEINVRKLIGSENDEKGVYSEMDKFFKLSEHGTTVRTEVLAGLTTFFLR